MDDTLPFVGLQAWEWPRTSGSTRASVVAPSSTGTSLDRPETWQGQRKTALPDTLSISTGRPPAPTPLRVHQSSFCLLVSLATISADCPSSTHVWGGLPSSIHRHLDIGLWLVLDSVVHVYYRWVITALLFTSYILMTALWVPNGLPGLPRMRGTIQSRGKEQRPGLASAAESSSPLGSRPSPYLRGAEIPPS